MVELLVSIAIIAVLIALLFGGISKMQHTSRNAGCLGNLKTLAQACFTYAQDHDNNLPFRYMAGGGYSGYSDPIWYVAVAPYADVEVRNVAHGELVEPGPFKCPADKIPWAGGGPGELRPSCSYAFPMALAIRKADGTPVTDGGFYANLSTRFPYPSETVLLIDSAYGNVFNHYNYAIVGGARNDPQETGAELLKRHQGHLNAAFADGHCEAIPKGMPTFDPDRPYLWGSPKSDLW